MLQQVKSRAFSPFLINSGPALPSASGIHGQGEDGRCEGVEEGHLFPAHAANRIDSIVLPRRGAKPAFPDDDAHGRQEEM